MCHACERREMSGECVVHVTEERWVGDVLCMWEKRDGWGMCHACERREMRINFCLKNLEERDCLEDMSFIWTRMLKEKDLRMWTSLT
jgi:hypothetical protein